MARVVVILVSCLLSFGAKAFWLEEGSKELGTKAGLSVLRRALPQSFFRHAKWAAPVRLDGKDIPKIDAFMDDEEFLISFPHISVERALDIYYILGVTQHLFQELHIKALPVGGTLLGMLRNGGQLPHDDDSDLAVLEENIDIIMANKKLLRTYGLEIREIPGLGIQIYPKGDRGSLAMGYVWLQNRFCTFLQKITGFDVPHLDLTKRGFIDVMPIRFHKEDQVYRYAGSWAEQIWWQQTIAPALFESEFVEYPYGPITLMGPELSLALQANEEVYPHSLTHVMRTPDHRRSHNIEAVLVLLKESQKAPFPLSPDDLANLEKRFADVGLDMKGSRLAH